MKLRGEVDRIFPTALEGEQRVDLEDVVRVGASVATGEVFGPCAEKAMRNAGLILEMVDGVAPMRALVHTEARRFEHNVLEVTDAGVGETRTDMNLAVVALDMDGAGAIERRLDVAHRSLGP